ncbi:putative 4-hydroxybenzoyl-CoA thioesterase [Labilithrix luteola]|uniref:Putative 4-hydroxybenzoyl-CoA thioesterase n=1 Tax=Labilithrix luteola TaxID=1391654 RepID=A0A0K1Q222_9BACT|nr:thioesterase family protein [Labilithrix luteola]AKU99701.1 putative 4-hydroxybenzoyl-CoA thioesterase [Labilithrix luteola]
MPLVRPRASDYRYFVPISTRWMDNDVYGHVNNVTYYSYFDTVANHFLIREGGLDIERSDVIGLVVESKCNYHAPLAYPQQLRGGLRIDKLGQRSVVYGVGIFAEHEDEAAADGHFVHVFVDRATRKPTAIPDRILAALESLRDGL